MKVKILLGSIKLDREYKTGEILDASENDAKSWIREGIVEKVREGVAEEKPKQEGTPIVEKPATPTPESKVPNLEPSMDWTAKEILDYGNAKGVKELEGRTKQEMLNLIKVQKGGEKE